MNLCTKIFVTTLGNTHTYPLRPLRKIKLDICNHQANFPFYQYFGTLRLMW